MIVKKSIIFTTTVPNRVKKVLGSFVSLFFFFRIFKEMANLISGVLVKLLEEMAVDEKVPEDCKPVMLQIRSIIPILAEDDIWPNQGFYLKVSDASHSMYVSLPHENDDMVLCNKLRLGQLIYVEKLEGAYPVPMLKGVKLVPGRRSCIGNPKDLVAIENLANVSRASDSLFSMEMDKKPQERFRSQRFSRVRSNEDPHRQARRSRTFDIVSESSDVMKSYRKISSGSVDKDSDTESTISSSSSVTAFKRRSWNGGDISDSQIIKHGRKPTGRSRSVSPVFCAGYDSLDDNSSPKSRRKDIGIDMKSVKSSNKCRIPMSAKCCESLDPAVVFSLVDDKKLTETTILWSSLPSTLVKLGKEVLRHRDVALLAAVEALQEAAAGERLLKCLRTYSELQAAKGADRQPLVDNFFSLQDDLGHTQQIIELYANSNLLRAKDSNPKGPGSIRECLKLALDRKKNATTWIRAALVSDLTLFSATGIPKRTTNVGKKTSITYGSKTKGTCMARKHVNSGEIQVGLAAETNSSPQWFKGSALHAAVDLKNSLHDECRRWFLAFVEDYLDEVKEKTISMESDSQVAEMMCQIKRVSDWLDVMVSEKAKSLKMRSKDGAPVEDSELEAFGRVRDKIYMVLLKHVERTCHGLENMNAIAEG
ncbi:hypothetical protein F2P56_028820 [Juglans regia]|uniref:Uncharacterized protein LOC108979734 isoform X2 n=2 Tax=Juglans regia TaxID=51240 RepID=A0A2I4DFU0_JUGRE|nr:uncharacterized protein LOC108979734 isoform X2 [Juglans regia]KAF5448266.1 hypothetical protein F2P56_028820 [Juglans regia]